MSKLHIFNLNTDTCESCGISHKEMIATQAMNDCPGDEAGQYFNGRVRYTINDLVADHRELIKDKRVYIKARMDEETMEVEVVDHGIWIPLDIYRRQCRLNESGDKCSFWKSGVERPGAKYTLLESIPENEAEGTGKCKHDGFDSALQRCRNCGMAAIDIEIERSNDFNRKFKKPVSQIEQVPVKEQEKNYCAPGDVFSQCKAGMNWKEHQKCRFSEKASRASRCMYFRNLNGTKHCDNHKAQKALYLSTGD